MCVATVTLVQARELWAAERSKRTTDFSSPTGARSSYHSWLYTPLAALREADNETGWYVVQLTIWYLMLLDYFPHTDTQREIISSHWCQRSCRKNKFAAEKFLKHLFSDYIRPWSLCNSPHTHAHTRPHCTSSLLEGFPADSCWQRHQDNQRRRCCNLDLSPITTWCYTHTHWYTHIYTLTHVWSHSLWCISQAQLHPTSVHILRWVCARKVCMCISFKVEHGKWY